MKMAADGSQISLTRRNKPGTKAKVRKNLYFVHLNANKLHLCYEWCRYFPPFAVDFTLIVQFSAWGVCIVNSFFFSTPISKPNCIKSDYFNFTGLLPLAG